MPAVIDIYRKAAMVGILVLGLSMFVELDFCFFYNYVGIPCPSCGMTRAFKSLLQFDLGQAFKYHPLFPLVLVLPYLWLKPNHRLMVAIVLVFIAVWLWRLYCFFPEQAPMVVKQTAFIYRLSKLMF